MPLSMGLLDQMHCGSDTPLDTPYFIPFHKTAQPAVGCASQAVQEANKTEVHVIRLRRSDKEVYLHVAGPPTNSLALVLATANPVTWHLTVSGFSSPPDILVSDESSVVDVNSGHQMKSTPAYLSSPEITRKLAIKEFSHINTFTTIDTANRIYIELPPEISTSTCDLNNELPSPAVSAYYMERQSTYGCYHPEAAGLLPNDVHVIDLRTHSRLVKRSEPHNDSGSMPEIVVDLLPDLTGDAPLPRNLTLILKSDKPVRWLLKSHGIKGQLVVAAGENPVENLSVGSSQHLDIQKTEIPDQFERLMKEVTHQYGIPLSYMRVHEANLLEMIIPPRSKRDLSNLWDRNMPAYNRDLQGPSHTAFSDPEKIEDKIYDAMEAIESVMVKKCTEKNKEVTVSVPQDVIVKYGIGSITLNDPSCQAVKTENYWVLKSHSTACGSTALTSGVGPMYRNNLHVQFVRGSLAGQIEKIPFICKFKSGIPGITAYEDEEGTDTDYHLRAEEPDLSGDEMYSLKVQLVSEDEKKQTLLEKKSDSATAAIGDNIYVSTHIEAAHYLALATEQCWLSNTSRVTPHATPKDMMLISTGCPANKGVSLQWDKESSTSAFLFKMNPEFLGASKVWIQCRMGLCSATDYGVTGNIRRCVDPTFNCEDKRSPHKESTVQQVTVRGPLHIIQMTQNNLGHPAIAQKDIQRSSDGDYSELEKIEDTIYNVAEEVENVMVLKCDEKKKDLSVSVPKDIIKKHGIGSITLNDASCQAVKTASHWVLVSHSTTCGSTALTYGAGPMYRNNLHIHFNKGTLAGRKGTVPFICKFEPGIPGISVKNDYDDDEENDDIDYNMKAEEPDLSGEEMYSLTVQLVSEDENKRATLMDKKSDSATAAIGDKIYVSSNINAVPYLALAIEQCWLSNTSYVTSHATQRDEMLISTGCPAKKGVSVHWDKGSSNSAFSFKINQEFLGQSKVWIQCRMGLCSATDAGVRGNMEKCVDPKLDCENRNTNIPHKQSSVQQITVRGPLHIIPVNRNTLGHSPIAHSEMQETDMPSYNTQTSRTLVEVPVEVAVAIALASFLVGAMSTGVLWCLHSRAMQAKSVSY